MSSDHPFQRQSLELKYIINIARGAVLTDWPEPLPGAWQGRFRDLKVFIDRGDLPAALRAPSANKWAAVEIHDLWRLSSALDDKWQWLREFCENWGLAGSHALQSDAAAISPPGKPQSDEQIEAKKPAFLEWMEAERSVWGRYPGRDRSYKLKREGWGDWGMREKIPRKVVKRWVAEEGIAERRGAPCQIRQGNSAEN